MESSSSESSALKSVFSIFHFEHRCTVGERVRIMPVSKEDTDAIARTAVISYVHPSSSTTTLTPSYDIIYDGISGEEETDIVQDRVRKLEPFESIPFKDIDNPEKCKEYGNTLFSLKDYENAKRYYNYGLSILVGTRGPLVGSSVIVILSPQSAEFVHGIVSYINHHPGSDGKNNDDYEVILNSGEEIHSRVEQLVIVHDGRQERILQRAIYMNLSRCALKENKKGWAVRYVSIAIAICNSLMEESMEQYSGNIRKLLADALFMRARIFLTANRPAHAKIDAEELRLYDSSRAEQLFREVDVFKHRRRVENRKLAKEIARWVNQAMTTNVEKSGEDLLIEEEAEEESTAETSPNLSSKTNDSQSSK